MEQGFEKLLATSQLRITKARVSIFKTLTAASGPLSHVEIARCTPEVDKVSIYRTIELFLALGVVTAIPFGWKQRYELAAPFRPHHHHLSCVKCGEVKEFQSEELERLINNASADFLVLGHTFEVTGICGKCNDREV